MVHLGEQRSRYTQYLPSVLWSAETDPLQFLSRLLCIFEQILTEMPVVEQTAAVVAASDTQIEVTSATDAERFRPYDRVTIAAAEGEIATEQVQIRQVEEVYLHLLTPLKGTYSSGTVTLIDYASIESAIDAIPQLFNPWRTPPQFLPWLASWVALSLQDNWSEYQRRKFIAEMMSIYQQRGLKRGLMTYLDIYAATEANPRIAIDDGEAIFRASWTRQQTLKLHAVAYSHGLVSKDEAEPAAGEQASVEQAVLLHPTAIAIDSQNHYIVADRGGEERQGRRTQTWPPTLWRVSNTGEVPHRDMRPQPIYTGDLLRNPVAVVVDAVAAGDHCYVLVQGETNTAFPTAIYRFELSATEIAENSVTGAIAPVTAEPVTVIDQAGWAIEPLDMVLDESQPDTKRLIVLDRGDPFASSPQQPPKLIVVDIDGDPPFTPTREQTIELNGVVIEPTALAVAPDGTVLIANARDNRARAPAELLRISLAEQPPAPLLAEVPAADNPLIYPTGLVWKDAQTVIVSDRGVRGSESSSERTLAEPAALYQVDLSSTPPRIQQLTRDRRLVRPSKIALDRQQQVVIVDQGDSHPQREWRAWPNEFGVVVLFSRQRDTSSDQRNQIRFEIEQVVNEQKPGHAAWWMNSV